MSPPAEDKTYLDAIDDRAREALELANRNAQAVAGLIVTTRTLSADVSRAIEDRREVDAAIITLGQTLRTEMNLVVTSLHERITRFVNRTYWVAGFSAAAGVVAGVLIAR